MSHFTRELPRDTWRSYFDELSRELGAVAATVEVDGEDLGAQIEAENLMLRGVSYDDRDDVFVVALDASGRPTGDVEHMVYGPRRIFVDTEVGIFPDAIDVEDADGHMTLVQLRSVAELPGG